MSIKKTTPAPAAPATDDDLGALAHLPHLIITRQQIDGAAVQKVWRKGKGGARR